MNNRIKTLREKSLKAIPFLSHERALLITDFYKSGAHETVPVPIARALCFKYILEKKKLFIEIMS